MLFCFNDFILSNIKLKYYSYLSPILISHKEKINDIIIKINETTKTNHEIDKKLIDKVKHIKSDENREFYLKLLLLYLFGGIIVNPKINIVCIETINDYLNSNKLCIVKSKLFNTIFDGFMCCSKLNKDIGSFLYKVIETNDVIIDNKINLKHDFFKKILLLTNENNVILYEDIINNVSYIKNNLTIICEHYYYTPIIDLIEFNNNKKKDLTHLKIGITIDIPNNLSSFYSNGIRQNTLYFYELLKNLNYEVKLIIGDTKNANIIDSISFYKYEYTHLNNIFLENFDLIFSFGFSIPSDIFKLLKKQNVKIVAYMCGNSYIIDSEKILYDQHPSRTINYNFTSETYDEIWSIPQMFNQNKCYWETIYNTKCVQVPFIWSNNSINFIKTILNIENEDELLYKKKENKVAVFEPNISVMKWCLPCVCISELYNRKYNNLKHLYITNIDLENNNKNNNKINIFNFQEFNNICKNLSIFKEKKMSVEKRYITLNFMKDYADIAISHQWENPLNYLYFDLAWMGWPILHNAYLCKDIGYFYNGFDYQEAADKLQHIILNHDANKMDYLNTNRKIINNFLPSDKLLQNTYKNLIHNLFK